MNPNLIPLALDIANESAASDIECRCVEVSDNDAGNGRWYDLDRLIPDSVWERANIDRAERFLELAGRIERRRNRKGATP